MKRPVLFEDTTMYYNKWVQGIASRDQSGQRTSLKDLLKVNDQHLEQNPNNAKADTAMPYPLANAVSILGELVVTTSNALSLFRNVNKNPVLKKDKKAHAEILLIITALKKSMHVLNWLLNRLQRP